MILTQCAVCATDLGLSLGKKCGRCSTRYCGAECQVQHWKEGGHDKLCKLIKRGGGAEQYNANQRYAKAVAVAAEKCAEDTKGQTCFICTQALHWKTKEGLVRGMLLPRDDGGSRMCRASRNRRRFCVPRPRRIKNEVENEHRRWHTCGLCEQEYHGAVRCALGWACWKTYLGRAETDVACGAAMQQLGNGLFDAGHHEDALSVRGRVVYAAAPWLISTRILITQSNQATTYQQIGRFEQAQRIQRDVYSGHGEGSAARRI